MRIGKETERETFLKSKGMRVRDGKMRRDHVAEFGVVYGTMEGPLGQFPFLVLCTSIILYFMLLKP